MRKLATILVAAAIISSCNEETGDLSTEGYPDATAYTLGTRVTGTTQCSDIERYSFEVTQGPVLLNVDAVTPYDWYDELYLNVGQYDPDLDEITGLSVWIEGDNNDEDAVAIVLEDGQYYVEVDGTEFTGGCNIAYDFELSTDVAPADDSFETDNLLSQANELPAYTTQSGVSWNLDLKTITIPEGYNAANVSLEATGIGIFDWGIVEAQICSIASEVYCHYAAFSETNGIEIDTDSETVTLEAGTYLLAILPPEAFSYLGTEYDIYWEPVYLAEDAYEDNDSISQATPLSEGETITANQFDDDWYEIEVLPGYEHLTIELYFSHDQGDIDIELVDANGDSIESSEGTDDNELIEYTVSEPGTYYLLVYYDNAGNAYELVWNGEAPN